MNGSAIIYVKTNDNEKKKKKNYSFWSFFMCIRKKQELNACIFTNSLENQIFVEFLVNISANYQNVWNFGCIWTQTTLIKIILSLCMIRFFWQSSSLIYIEWSFLLLISILLSNFKFYHFISMLEFFFFYKFCVT